MKKHTLLLGLIMSLTLMLMGCNGERKVAEQIPDIFPDEVDRVAVTHYYGGEEKEWIVEKRNIKPLKDWVNSLLLNKKMDFKEGEYPGENEEGGELFYFDFGGSYPDFSYRSFGESYLVVEDEWYLVSNPSNPPIEEGNGEEILADLRPMVMMNGEIYLDTGKEDASGAKRAIACGQITSSVNPSEKPTENGQSNFGNVGSDLALLENTLYVNIGEKWIRFEKEESAQLGYDKIPMVMVNGKLYSSTGQESTLDGRCGVMDGEISSSVDGSEVPTQDDESNFGVGYGYQYGVNGTIEVYMPNGEEDAYQWVVFTPSE